MIATFRSQHSKLTRAALTALLLAAFGFLASVIIGGGDASFIAVATAVGATGLLMVLSHWLHRPVPKQQPLAFQYEERKRDIPSWVR